MAEIFCVQRCVWACSVQRCVWACSDAARYEASCCQARRGVVRSAAAPRRVCGAFRLDPPVTQVVSFPVFGSIGGYNRVPPPRTGFYCEDLSIRYPYFAKDTVTDAALYVVGAILPITLVSRSCHIITGAHLCK